MARRRSSPAPLEFPGEQTLGPEDHQHDDQQRVKDHAQVAELAQPLTEHGQQDRGDDDTRGIAHATQDHHHDNLDGSIEPESLRRDVLLEMRVYAAGHAGEEGPDQEGRDLVARGVDAHGLGGDLVIGYGNEASTVGGIDHRPHHIHGQCGQAVGPEQRGVCRYADEAARPRRMFRILALVTGVQHRIAQKSGNKYGSYTIEDFSGKTDFVLFSEDYLRLSPYLLQGSSVCITGFFRPRYNQLEFEFKVQQVCLAETLKKQLTRQVNIQVHPQHINNEMICFVEKNIRNFPGNTTLKFIVNEPKKELKISLVSTDKGLEMNDELIHFFEDKPELEIQVVTG